MTTFLVPIEGLTLIEPWQVGPIRLHTAASLDPLLASTATRLLDHEIVGKVYREIVGEMAQGTVAQVDAPDIDAALDLVTVATDILRVFQKIQNNLSGTTMFGLPGQLYRSRVRYLTLGKRAAQASAIKEKPLVSRSAKNRTRHGTAHLYSHPRLLWWA